MIDLSTLINYWNKRLGENPPSLTDAPHEITIATITYLNAYRQTRLMLKALAADQREWEREPK